MLTDQCDETKTGMALRRKQSNTRRCFYLQVLFKNSKNLPTSRTVLVRRSDVEIEVVLEEGVGGGGGGDCWQGKVDVCVVRAARPQHGVVQMRLHPRAFLWLAY
jgi:hypothetical protein